MINNRDGNWTSNKSEAFINRMYQLDNWQIPSYKYSALFIITYTDNWTAEYTEFTFILCDGFRFRYYCRWIEDHTPEEIYNCFIDDRRVVYDV